MRLLVDEDTQAKTLVRLLREAGHDVLTAEGAGLNSLADAEVLARAVAEGRILLTCNCADFLTLAATLAGHAGVLGIYQGSDPSRGMTYTEIVRAVGHVEQAGLALRGTFQALNAWLW